MHSSTSRSTATPGRARTRSPGPTSTLNYAEPLPAHSTPPRQPSPACANSDSAESSLSEPIWSRIPVVPYHDYTAAKAALLALTRTLSADLGPDGITVNMVSGGLLRTTDASAATPEAVFDMIAASTPLRRVTTPDEFADAALFFASPWSRAVTGQNLVVDGGLVKN